jgi:hypothetical protein
MLHALKSQAQDDLMQLLEEESNKEVIEVESVFKGTRIINGHAVETRGKGVLDLIFSHRFGRINSGVYNLWGLDEAWIRIGGEYAFTDDLTLGVGRSSVDKTYDGFVKYKFLKQTTGNRRFPFTATALASVAVNTLKPTDPERKPTFSQRLAYTYQLLLARKFSPSFSLQIMPSLVHRNLVASAQENNDIYSLGIAARQKITRRMALTVEYYYQFNQILEDINNPLGLGLEIETGGHVFQIVVSNSRGMIERAFITETTGNFFDGDLHLGFNISRVFQLKKQTSGNIP